MVVLVSHSVKVVSSSSFNHHHCHYHNHNAINAINAISTMSGLRQYHSLVVRLGLSSHNPTVARLIKFAALSPSGDLSYALRLFRLLPCPDAFIYNTLFLALSSHPSPSPLSLSPSRLLSHMLHHSVSPNHFTFPPLLRATSLPFGRQLHSLIYKLGFSSDSFARNNLLCMYLQSGCPYDACKVFYASLDCDIVAWTTMVTGFSKAGLIDHARALFDTMPERNLVSWNAMIAGYVQAGLFKEALDLFDQMQAQGIEINKYVGASVLSACTGLGTLEKGEFIHTQIQSKRIKLDSKLATTLIDMYCKCGCLEKAIEVFNSLPAKKLSTWNCMIGGFAIHGRGIDAIQVFKNMESQGGLPDDITFLNVLIACAHSRLVAEGKHYFDYMVQKYNMEPKMEHYGCMVDMLGRAGLLKEAKQLILEMPMEPNADILGALLGACKIHGVVDLGQEIGKRAIELDPLNSGRYVLLANLFAGAGRWDDVAEVRKLMGDRGVHKEAGHSLIEMNGVLNKFVCGGRSHPQGKEIYSMLDEMLERIKAEGYVADAGVVSHDLTKEQKVEALYYHSEKLAIAFGLIHTRAGDTIRITKNLRVCRDCHEATKFVSRVFDREIILRDRNRFHHFKRGDCSCKDYW
ncbi:Pentatricopeptide repeat-containing protein [Rhynchospora pubera]|uniref:Pentatricopeptide repeat-containing protein n=1 Tax=Rhynchospora pubera TaxID=906938 RepID=A0AAV8HFA5_9POAL|nr:Pentatricopeptide repeat-containing protein [Rhynchospora pubera]